MKITFVLPHLHFCGGVNGVLKYAEQFNLQGHDCQVWYPLTKFRGFNKPFVHPYALESQIPDADVIIATSWETAYVVQRARPQKGRRVYYIQHYEQWDLWNGITTEPEPIVDATYKFPMKHVLTSHIIRNMLPIKNEDDVVVYWGREVPDIPMKDYSTPMILYQNRPEIWKGVGTLKPVLEKIHKEFPDVEIRSYGTPYVPSPKLNELFQRCTIFVNPAWIDGFAEAPFEAAGYGCAVISTDMNAMPELFRRDMDMLFVPPKDEKALYKSIVYLIEREERRRFLGMNARNRAFDYPFIRAFYEFERAITE